MAHKADYENLVIPEDKDREDYSYQERRTAIYELIKKRGDPAMLPKYQTLGDQFGVSAEQIRQDIERIKEYIRDNLGKDAKTRTDFIYDKAIEEKVQNNQWEEAVEMIERKNNWLFNIGAVEKEPEKREVEHSGSIQRIREIYEEEKKRDE